MELKTVSDDLNFCRVFKIPNKYPEGFCFSGGKPVVFQMIDWFQPIPPSYCSGDDMATWDDLKVMLENFLLEKRYIRPGNKYLIITDFGESMILDPEKSSKEGD